MKTILLKIDYCPELPNSKTKHLQMVQEPSRGRASVIITQNGSPPGPHCRRTTTTNGEDKGAFLESVGSGIPARGTAENSILRELRAALGLPKDPETNPHETALDP